MSAHTADSQFSFQLPRLSYIDARWEEPALREPAVTPAAAGKRGLAAWWSRQIANVVAWRRDSVAVAELSSMTDHELMDIGLNRADLSRVFRPDFSNDLIQRGK
jgi:uncharacterized protein YjiS (DUF1127 family)